MLVNSSYGWSNIEASPSRSSVGISPGPSQRNISQASITPMTTLNGSARRVEAVQVRAYSPRGDRGDRMAAMGPPINLAQHSQSSAPALPIADASSITPAVHAWIECLVDSRVDQACRGIREHEIANLVNQTQREGASTSETAAQAVRHAEEVKQHVDSQVRNLASAQARLLALVEGLSGDSERQKSFASQARADGRAEAFVTVERVMSSVNELQRTVEQDGDSTSARLRQHEAVLEELRRSVSEESARHRTSFAELQKAQSGFQSETTGRQRQCVEELGVAGNAIAATRQEVTDLMQVIQRLEKGLSTWRSEIYTEVSQEMRSAREATRESAVQDIETLRREMRDIEQNTQMLENRLATWRAEVSKEVRAAAGAQEEYSVAGFERVRSEAAKQWSDTEHHLEHLRLEIAGAVAAREPFEFRVQESHAELRRTIDFGLAGLREDFATHRGNLTEELANSQRHLAGELRAEMKGLLKAEQKSMAALDEQLWQTDQRLGQRIDEIMKAASRGDRSISTTAVGTGAFDGASLSPPMGALARTPLLASSTVAADDGVKELSKVYYAEPIASSSGDRTELRRALSPAPLSDAEQLERLRNARKRCNALGNEFRSELFNATGGLTEKLGVDSVGRGVGVEGSLSVLALAHEAAEVFREHGRITPRSDAGFA